MLIREDLISKLRLLPVILREKVLRKNYYTNDDLTYKENSIQERLLVFDNRRKNNQPLSLEDLNIFFTKFDTNVI